MSNILKCPVHKKYKGKLIPAHIDCDDCWQIFERKNPYAAGKLEYLKNQKIKAEKKAKAKLAFTIWSEKKEYEVLVKKIKELFEIKEDKYFYTFSEEIKEYVKKYTIYEFALSVLMINIEMFWGVDKNTSENVKEFILFMHSRNKECIGKKWLNLLKNNIDKLDYELEVSASANNLALYSENKISHLLDFLNCTIKKEKYQF
jgi:hypothetical protein